MVLCCVALRWVGLCRVVLRCDASCCVVSCRVASRRVGSSSIV